MGDGGGEQGSSRSKRQSIAGRPFASHDEADAWIGAMGFEITTDNSWLPVADVIALFERQRNDSPLSEEGLQHFHDQFSKAVHRVFKSSVKKRVKLFREKILRYNLTAPGCPSRVDPEAPPKGYLTRFPAVKKIKVPGASRNMVNAHHVHTRYVNEFLGMKCSPDLLRLKLFPDMKELTESLSVFNTVREHVAPRFPMRDERVALVAIGDGGTPRTASLFAFRTSWKCYSVDPQMQMRPEWDEVRNLVPARCKIEDYPIECDRAVVLLIHAHVDLRRSLKSLVMPPGGDVAIVGVPCCNFYHSIGFGSHLAPDLEFEDQGMVTPHRLTRVWVTTKGALEALPPAPPMPKRKRMAAYSNVHDIGTTEEKVANMAEAAKGGGGGGAGGGAEEGSEGGRGSLEALGESG